MKRDVLGDFFKSLIAIILGGGILDLILKTIATSPGPFLSEGAFKLLDIIIPTFLDIGGFIWGFVLSILLTLVKN